jgi:DNA-binding CsgD family transcriptional regulator
MKISGLSEFERKVIIILSSNIKRVISFGAIHIGYRYFLDNGESLGFTTNPHWYEREKNHIFFENQRKYFENEILFLVNSGSSYVTRSLYQSGNEYLVELNTRGMSNSVGIYRFLPHKVEHFFFISDSDDSFQKDLMLNNLDSLEDAIEIISNELDIIVESPKPKPKPEFLLNKVINKTIFNKINEKVSKRNHNLYYKGKIIKLTNRELEVLKLLKNNNSNKVIAEYLGIAPRTIDSFINNLKLKFHCNRSMLIKISGESYVKNLYKNMVS